jgi:tRNA G10  N-methylase Trm11
VIELQAQKGEYKMEKTELVELMDEVSFFNDFSKEEKLSLSDLKDSILKFEQKANLIKEGSIEISFISCSRGKRLCRDSRRPI